MKAEANPEKIKGSKIILIKPNILSKGLSAN
jgi:hypothetical protein